MGERQDGPIRLDFDASLKVEFHGSRITSDAGLLPYRELDEALGLTQLADSTFDDWRSGQNIRHSISALFRQAVYSRLAGYEDTNDAERLRVDPAMRHVVGGRARQHEAASVSQMSRFETEVLRQPDHLDQLIDLSGQWIDRVHRRKPISKIILDMDSSVSETHGAQEGSTFNGYFGCTCYHPLFLFNQFGDLERCLLRNGNVHSADDWRSVLEPVVDRYRSLNIPHFYRGDAAFAQPDLYEYLEEEGYGYVIRLKRNRILESMVDPALMARPVGRPSSKPLVRYQEFIYQAESWDCPRRVIAMTVLPPQGLFAEPYFLVTNLHWSPRRVVEFYNNRGIAEQWIKEGKYALNWTRLSCREFDCNQVRLQLFGLAYNLGNFMRRLALPCGIAHWSQTTLQNKLIKIGAKVIRHARYTIFQMAEVAVPRRQFKLILNRIRRLAHARSSPLLT